MRVTFLHSCATGEGSYTARREYELSDDLARGFIASGLAVAADGFEEAVIDEPTEEAVVGSRKGKRK